MVKAEPALLLLVGELGKSLIDRAPVAQVLEAGRFSFADGLLHILCAQVADVFGKVHVYLGHFVLHQEKTDFPEGEPQVVFFGILVELDGTHAEAHFDKNAYAVEGNAQFLGKFGDSNAVLAGVTDFFQDSHVTEGLGGMETEGGESDFLSLELGVHGVDLVFGIKVKHSGSLYFGPKYSFFWKGFFTYWKISIFPP